MDEQNVKKTKKRSIFNTDKFGINVSRRVGRVLVVVLFFVGIGAVVFVGRGVQGIVRDSIIQDVRSNAEYTELKYNEAKELADNYTEAVRYSKTSHLNEKHPEKYKSEVTGKELCYTNYRAEVSMLNTSFALLRNDDNVEGAGIILDPGEFEPGQEYAWYIY